MKQVREERELITLFSEYHIGEVLLEETYQILKEWNFTIEVSVSVFLFLPLSLPFYLSLSTFLSLSLSTYLSLFFKIIIIDKLLKAGYTSGNAFE